MSATSDLALGVLRKLIVSGALQDGERLVERDLAERFAISRIPLREAIQRLEQEGLVSIFPNRGAVVREMTAADLREIYELRSLLEGAAIYESVKNLDAETLARVELVHQLLAQEESPARQGELNLEFHTLLYSKCSNARQISLIQGLKNQVERYEHLQNGLLANTAFFQDEHAAILRACRDRNARSAKTLTQRHLKSALAIALQCIGDRSQTKAGV